MALHGTITCSQLQYWHISEEGHHRNWPYWDIGRGNGGPGLLAVPSSPWLAEKRALVYTALTKALIYKHVNYIL